MKTKTESKMRISKKILCTTVLMLCISLANAQTSKKNTKFRSQTKSVVKSAPVTPSSKSGFDKSKLQVGGNVQGNFSSQGGSGSSNFGVSGFGGYKITDDILLGAKIGTTFSKGVTDIEFGVFGRYYYEQFFGGAGINVSNRTVKFDLGPFGSFKQSVTLTYASLEGGYRIPVSDKVTMETSVNLNLPISPAGAGIWYSAKVGAVYSF